MRLWRMERRCAGGVDAAGVAGGEMGEDSLDDLGRLDARDDAQRGATPATALDVDVEVKLIRLGGHLILWEGGIHHAEIKTAVRAGVPAPDD